MDIAKVPPQEMTRIWWVEGRDATFGLTRPGEIILDGFDPSTTADSYSESYDETQTLILQWEDTDASQFRLVAFQPQHPYGKPGFHLTLLRGVAFIWDVVTFPIQILTMGTMDFMPLQCRKA